MTKRSVVIAGHRTSVSLEQPFWDALHDLARARGLSVPALIADIDAARTETGAADGLSAAIRLHLFAQARAGRLGTET